ncbi:MAG: hypothetical protein L0H31_12825, partial [Nocardioidaceae bacterium]|nr:hypothetical protein [Nocardioidaceae bacterium]
MTTTADTGTVWGLGAFAFPQGLLLVEGYDDVRTGLAAGVLPTTWPDELRAHDLAHAGQLPAASSVCTG